MDTYTLLNVSESVSVSLRYTSKLETMSKWDIHVHVLGYFYRTHLWNKYTIVIVN